MESKYLDFELDAEDVRLYAQFTQYMQTTLIRAKRDYLEKELNYRGMLSNEIVSLEEQYDLADPKAVEEIERLLNWEMIKSHLNVLTLREAEVISCLFINKMTQEEIDWYILHQANRRIVEAVAKRLEEPIEKFPMNLQEYGNTSSASIPILLDEMNRTGKLKAGQKIMMAGFGAGLTWGATIIEWHS